MIEPGCLAEFPSEEALLAAIRALRERKYERLDVYGPRALEGADKSLGLSRSWLNWLVFPLAFGGAGIGYLIQWYVNAVDYPLDVGGRPPHSWPAFIPITFETAILFGGVGAFLLFFLLARLPRLWQPIFDVPGFESSSSDRFWLGIDRRDLSDNPEHVLPLLVSLGASRAELVPSRRQTE
jgi:hypothetical protein